MDVLVGDRTALAIKDLRSRCAIRSLGLWEKKGHIQYLRGVRQGRLGHQVGACSAGAEWFGTHDTEGVVHH